MKKIKYLVLITIFVFLLNICDINVEAKIEDKGNGFGRPTEPCDFSKNYACVYLVYYQVRLSYNGQYGSPVKTLSPQNICPDNILANCAYSRVISPRFIGSNAVSNFLADSGLSDIKEAYNKRAELVYCPVFKYQDRSGISVLKTGSLMASYIRNTNKFSAWTGRSDLLYTLENYAQSSTSSIYAKDCGIVRAIDIYKPTPTKYYCKIVSGKYYDKYGNIVSKAEYEKSCETPPPPIPSYGTIKIIKMSSSGNLLSGAQFSLYRGSSCSGFPIKYGISNSSGEITFSGLSADTYYSYRETSAPSGYVANSSCYSVYLQANTVKTERVYNNPEEKYEKFLLHVDKIDPSGNKINLPFKVAIYDGYGCDQTKLEREWQITGSGHIEYLDPPVTAEHKSIKEIVAPEGYELSDRCYNYDAKKGQKITIKIENKKSADCTSDFNSLSNKNNMDLRIGLYNKYKEKGKNYNALLNLNNKTGEQACKNVTCNPPSVDNLKCLSGDFGIGVTFNSSNLSCYNELIDSDGSKALCFTSFDLSNSLGTTEWTVKSGQMPFQISNRADAIATVGTVTKKCYTISTSFNPGKYSDYGASIIKFGGGNLSASTTDLNATLSETESSGKWHVYSKSVNYYFSSVYSMNGSGTVSYTGGDNYKFLGYGIISEWKSKQKYNVPFSVTLPSSSLSKSLGKTQFEASSSGACTVIPEQELITTYDDEPDKLNLEFRIIDTTNPFPGIGGNGRNVGSNWSKDEDNLPTNEIVQEVMSKNNSYNKNKEQPKYKIVLTPDIISEIKEYNKNHKYDDYTLTCTNGEDCASTFLDDLSKGKINGKSGFKKLVMN